MDDDHFSERAGLYARYRPTYPPAVADALAAAAPGRSLAWEAGCGSGQLSTVLASVFDRVHATDGSAAQLEGARPHPHVHYACEPAEACSLGRGAADLVVAAQAAHWFDIEGFYAEARRVARPAGVVALLTYGATRIAPQIDPVVEDFRLGTLEAYWPPQRRHVDAGYATLPFPFERLPSPELELQAHWPVDDYIGYVSSWSGVRTLLKAGGQARFDRFADALRQAWGTDGPRLIRWPLTVILGRV